MEAAELVVLQNVLTTRYVSAAGLVLLLYDHLLTLDAEVEYIWTSASSVAKILFLILRYMVPSFLLAQTILRTGLPVIDMSDVAYAGWLSIVISNFLVMLRIWATLPHARRLRLWFIIFFTVAQLASFAATTWVISLMIPVLVFDPLVGLCTFSSKPDVVGLWVVGLAFEVVVFTTVCWNALDRPRVLGSDPDAAVTRMFVRDGAVYFTILFALRIANTVIAVVAPVSNLFVVVFFIWAATTVTTSRLIINSRRTAGKAAQLRALQAAVSAEEYRGSQSGSTRSDTICRRGRSCSV
ncbi:hypothetical protein DFH07DRAFT_950464 [Mycena maculata]|uniref:DUF6533 domain-containing protein n=1 Tax=Mycena maculata TaxID=230809 RepID=A0AAD7K911_9AGAR|nr:hypothetical protein DFH07DRAFT_950464 [Mycena maculata]